MKKILSVAAVVALTAGAAQAAPVLFSEVDDNPTPANTVTAAVAAEQASFLSNLSGVGTEDFEGFATGTAAPINVNFAGSAGAITATLSGGGVDVINGANGAGRFATSGTQSIETSSGGDFTMSFSTGISAFGFYGTDIGDFNGIFTLRLTETGTGTTSDIIVPGSQSSGSLLFFGFIDSTTSYSNIAFLNTGGGSSDVFGFDDLIIGDLGQITPAIPLPASVLSLLAGLGALAGFRMRRRPA